MIKQIKKMAGEQADLKARKTIAAQMKKNKVDLDFISKYTGLTLIEIGKL